METILSVTSSVAGWVLKASWQVSAIILMVGVAQWIFRNYLSPGWRFGLWLLALARLILPAAPESAFSIFNFAPGTVQFVRRVESSAGFVTTRRFAAPGVAKGSGSTITDRPQLNTQQLNDSPGPETSGVVMSALDGASRQQVGTATGPEWSWPIAFSVVWLGGTLLLALRVIWVPIRLNRQLASRHSPVSPVVLTILDQCQQIMGVRKVLPVVQSPAVQTPALMGFIRPWLLLPEGMADRFTPRELRFIFLHELAHLKRRDIAINWLMTIVQVLHWFNPLVWLAFNRMREDRELACDAAALSFASEGEKQPYGQTIIKLLAWFRVRSGLPMAARYLQSARRMVRMSHSESRWSQAKPL